MNDMSKYKLEPEAAHRLRELYPDYAAMLPAITEQLAAVVAAFGSTLGDDLLGIYLHGSMAMGCYNSKSSDVDILVVCESPLNDAIRRELTEKLLRIAYTPSHIELSVLRYSAIHPWHSPAPFEFHISDKFYDSLRASLDTNAPDSAFNISGDGDLDLSAHISVTCARGIRLYGMPIDKAFEPVPIEDYLDSVLDDYDWLKERAQSNPTYAVLNICRITRLLTGDPTVCSKREGAEWALTQDDFPCKPLIRRALDCYANGEGKLDDGNCDCLSELIAYTDALVAKR